MYNVAYSGNLCLIENCYVYVAFWKTQFQRLCLIVNKMNLTGIMISNLILFRIMFGITML